MFLSSPQTTSTSSASIRRLKLCHCLRSREKNGWKENHPHSTKQSILGKDENWHLSPENQYEHTGCFLLAKTSSKARKMPMRRLWIVSSVCPPDPDLFFSPGSPSESPATFQILLAATEVWLHWLPRCEECNHHAVKLPLNFPSLMWEQKREAKECQPQLLSYQFLASLLREHHTFLCAFEIRGCPICLQVTSYALRL